MNIWRLCFNFGFTPFSRMSLNWYGTLGKKRNNLSLVKFQESYLGSVLWVFYCLLFFDSQSFHTHNVSLFFWFAGSFSTISSAGKGVSVLFIDMQWQVLGFGKWMFMDVFIADKIVRCIKMYPSYPTMVYAYFDFIPFFTMYRYVKIRMRPKFGLLVLRHWFLMVPVGNGRLK